MKVGIVIFLSIVNLQWLSPAITNNTMNKEKIKIEVWSDVVCPFCYLGKKKLEKAIAKLHAQNKIEVVWHSFQLDPNFPRKKSQPSIEYLSVNKGLPINQVKQMCSQLASQGAGYGIDFRFDKSLTFNTFDAHRLIQWAKSHELSGELKEAFMNAYFSQGMDLSKESNLYLIIERVGLDINQAKEVLHSDAFNKAVSNDITKASHLGVGGVPYFLINGEKVISGAQSDEVFENLISDALNNQE